MDDPTPIDGLAADATSADGSTADAAFVERDGLYGAVSHIRACIAAGDGPAIGVDFALVADHRGNDHRGNDHRGDHDTPRPRIAVLAHGHNDGEGWAALCRLTSAAHASPRTGLPRRPGAVGVAKPLVASHLLGSGVPVGTVLLGHDSDVGVALEAGDHELAAALLDEWTAQLPEALAIELSESATSGFGLPGALLELAEAAGIPAVLRIRMPAPAAIGARDSSEPTASPSIPLPVFVVDPVSDPATPSVLSPRELAQSIVERSGLPPSAVDRLLAQTEELLATCRLDPEHDLAWREPKQPEGSVLGLTDEPGEALWLRTQATLDERHPGHPDALARRRRDELLAINRFGHADRYLAAAEAADTVRALGVRLSAESERLVDHLLGLSDAVPSLVDPATSVVSSTPPRFDLEVESARLGEVYRAIVERFGVNRAALVSECVGTSAEAGAGEPQGIVLGHSALLDFIPVEPSRFGVAASQFTREELDDAGFLTIGIRGSHALSALALSLSEVERVHGSIALPAESSASATEPSASETSAWLREHYPAEYLAGVLSFPPHGSAAEADAGVRADSVSQSQLPLLPVDVNSSTGTYRVEPAGLRTPLGEVPELSEAERDRIVAGQPFESIHDFARRATPARAAFIRLGVTGALDSVAALPGRPAPSRGQILVQVREALASLGPSRAPAPSHPAEPHALPLFDDDGQSIPVPPPPPAPPPPPVDHLETYRLMLDELGVMPAAELPLLGGGSTALVAGIRSAPQSHDVPLGDKRSVAMSLDDGSGFAETVFAEEAKQRVSATVLGARLLVVQGTTRQSDDGSVCLEGEQAWDLRALWAQWNDSRRSAAGASSGSRRKRV